MNILLWVIVAASIALVCFAIAKQTGFNVPSLPTNKWVRRGITISVVVGVVALLFPNAVVTIAGDTISWAKDFDENFGKAPAIQPVEQSAQAVYQPETRRNVITVTNEEFTEIPVPPGAVASFDCPYGAEARYYFTVGGGPLQKQDHDCAEGPVDIAGLGPVGHFRIAFTSKTEEPQDVRYKVTF